MEPTETIAHGRRVFEATMQSAQALHAKDVPAAAICAGLLGVITEIGRSELGPRETARMLRLAADELLFHANDE